MSDLNIIFNLIYKFILFVAAMTILTNPEAVGEWNARMDIAHDKLWMEWVGDCDCTEPLE
jgi:hypothetical protein